MLLLLTGRKGGGGLNSCGGSGASARGKLPNKMRESRKEKENAAPHERAG